MGVFEGKFPQWAYLIGYNAISALLWSLVFTRTALTVLIDGPERVYPAVRVLVLFTQSMATLEVVHAILGLVQAPVSTTLMQVVGRSIVLWMIIEAYPFAALSPFYASMVLAWSAADVLWYSYFSVQLVGGHQYRKFMSTQHTACYLLYPIGIFSGTVLGSTTVARHLSVEAHG
ncbi:hypothetical protein N0V93_010242 [Gnomoniopsis smithogilvyi]|uniref:Very-long-chain (3R)-3-hydroxyacyl-CoA dehydratase n=1 Tax=Gnomoniopsis smithogilvyi TaxID=1191159 RepID=A0A9W9CT29_9PEZI|nr:hypothetical protein N0V93_010242 [Gnomoniopsis smithogilvyi]